MLKTWAMSVGVSTQGRPAIRKIHVEKPSGTFDHARFDAQLKELGFPDVKDRTEISEEEADRYIKGGFIALLDAARSSGKPDVVDENALNNVTPKYGAMRSMLLFLHVMPNAEKGANKTLQRTSEALHAATTSLKPLGNGSADGRRKIIKMIKNVSGAARSLKHAMSQSPLGNANRTQVEDLKVSLSEFHEAVRKRKSIEFPDGLRLRGSDVDTFYDFQESLPYLMDKVPTLLDLPAVSCAMTGYVVQRGISLEK